MVIITLLVHILAIKQRHAQHVILEHMVEVELPHVQAHVMLVHMALVQLPHAQASAD